MPFDIPSYYLDKGLTMSFGESFITGKDYGGPIYIGNTTTGLTPNSALLELEVAKLIVNGYYKIGMSNSLGKTKLNNSVLSTYLALTQNLLGDPALGLWTGIPQCYNNITVTRNDSAITVSGINGNSTYISVVGINGGVTKRSASTDVTINGDVEFAGYTILNSHSLSIDGSLSHTYGLLSLSGGKLLINQNYIMEMENGEALIGRQRLKNHRIVRTLLTSISTSFTRITYILVQERIILNAMLRVLSVWFRM